MKFLYFFCHLQKNHFFLISKPFFPFFDTTFLRFIRFKQIIFHKKKIRFFSMFHFCKINFYSFLGILFILFYLIFFFFVFSEFFFFSNLHFFYYFFRKSFCIQNLKKYFGNLTEKMSHFASIYDERDAFFGILQVLIFPVLLFEAQTALKDKKASLQLFDSLQLPKSVLQ